MKVRQRWAVMKGSGVVFPVKGSRLEFRAQGLVPRS